MKIYIKIGEHDVSIEGNEDEVWHLLTNLHRKFPSDKLEIRHDEEKFPTAIDIIKYIEMQPDYTHSMGDIQEYFLKNILDLKNPSEKKKYNALNRMLKRARKQIENKNQWGNFVEEPLLTKTVGRSHFTTYKFIKKSI